MLSTSPEIYKSLSTLITRFIHHGAFYEQRIFTTMQHFLLLFQVSINPNYHPVKKGKRSFPEARWTFPAAWNSSLFSWKFPIKLWFALRERLICQLYSNPFAELSWRAFFLLAISLTSERNAASEQIMDFSESWRGLSFAGNASPKKQTSIAATSSVL